jgi:hypothetical protein
MRTKSRYREFKDGGRVDGELPIEPPTEQPSESAPPEAPTVAVETTPEQPQPETRDEAALALQRQIEELKRSEEMQRQQTALMQQPEPVTREQKLALWRQSGLSEEEAHFLSQHPEMIDHSDLTAFAVHQANQAHQRGSDGHFHAVKKIFDEQFNQGQAESPVMPPTPAFFRPPPPSAARKPSNYVSAPVSREVPTGSARPRGQVKLSPSEIEAVRISGITLEQYAREKLKYEGMKESGEYRDGRDQR